MQQVSEEIENEALSLKYLRSVMEVLDNKQRRFCQSISEDSLRGTMQESKDL